MKDALTASEEMLRSVLDTIPVRVFWKDLNSTYLGSNRLFANDAGLNRNEDVVNKNDFDFGFKEAEQYRAMKNVVFITLIIFQLLKSTQSLKRIVYNYLMHFICRK